MSESRPLSKLTLDLPKPEPNPLILCKNGKLTELLKLLEGAKHSKYNCSVFLLYAAFHGNLEVVRVLIDKYRAHPNYTSKEGITPLHCAAANGHLSVVKYLITSKHIRSSTCVHRESHHGDALYCVCHAITEYISLLDGVHLCCTDKHDHIEVIKFLMDYGWKLSEKQYGDALKLILLKGNINDLAYIIDQGHIPVEKLTNVFMCSPELTRYICDNKTVEYLLETGALTVTVKMIKGFFPKKERKIFGEVTFYSSHTVPRPICHTGPNPNLDILKHLIQNCTENVHSATLVTHDSDNYRESKPITLLEYACKHDISMLMTAIVEGNICSRDSVGRTPLHIACQYNKLGLVVLLLKEGADQNVVNCNEELPLHVAVSHSTIEIVKLVSSCDINKQDIFGNAPLHVACRCNKPEIISFLTKLNGCNQNLVNNDGQLPLHIAATHAGARQIEVVKTVSSCDVNKQDSNGNTPAHLACIKRGYTYDDPIDIVEYLTIEKKCRLTIHNNKKELPLHILIREKGYGRWTDTVAKLVRICADQNMADVEDGEGNTLLHVACSAGHQCIELIRYLVMEGNADISRVNKEGNLPLHFACKAASAEVIKLVSDSLSKESILSCNKSGKTALHMACCNMEYNDESGYERNRIMRHLVYEMKCEPVDYPDRFSDLDIEFACSNESDFELLGMIATKENVDGVKKSGKPLIIACRNNNIKAVDLFTQVLKCRCNFLDQYGKHPLHIACTKSAEMVDLLAEHSDVNVVQETYEEHTPLHIVCKNNMVDMAELLINKYKCDQFIKNRRDEFPLHLACAQSLPLVKLLSITPDLLKATTDFGLTPLHIACQNSKADIVLYLVNELEYDFSALITHSRHENPLQLACATGNLCIVKCLMENNLFMSETTWAGNTPLHIACSNKSPDVAQYLIDSGYSPSTVNSKKELPLHIACAKSLAIVEVVSYKSTLEELEAKTTDHTTPLHIAASCGLLDIVKYLVEVKNCSVFTLDNYGSSALAYACGNNRTLKIFPAIVKYLVQQGCSPLDKVSYHDSAIQKSIDLRRVDLFKALTDTESNINCLDQEGNTPLMLVFKQPSSQQSASFVLQSTRYLIGRKCRQDISNKEGNLALHLAIIAGATFKVIQLLDCSFASIRNQQGHTPLLIACQNKRLKEVRHMIGCCSHIDYNELLRTAAIKNDRNIVQFLISSYSQEICSTRKDSTGAAPIHYSRSLKILEILIQHDFSNMHLCDAEGNTPLHILCSKRPISENSESAIHFLLSIGAPIALQNGNNETPLHLILKHSKPQRRGKKNRSQFPQKSIILSLLSHGASVAVQDNQKNTPLHLACFSDITIIRCLLFNEAVDPPQEWFDMDYIKEVDKVMSTKNNNGNTPLHVACLNRDSDIVRAMCESQFKYDLTIQNSLGDTPLHIACNTGCFQLVDCLMTTQNSCFDALSIRNNHGNLPFHVALELFQTSFQKVNSSQTTLEYFTNNCSDINVQNNNLETLLHLACKVKNSYCTQLVAFFVRSMNADFKKVNCHKQLPLHIAASRSLDMVKLCCTQDIVNMKDEEGNTPLHIACISGQYKTPEFLLRDMKCNPNIKNQKRQIPLHCVCACLKMTQKVQNVILLLAWHTLKLQKDLCLQDINNDTPLHLLCRANAKHCVKALQQRGYNLGDISKQNNVGETPLIIACNAAKPDIELVRCLLACDPKCQLKEPPSDTALHIACRKHNKEVIQCLLHSQHKQSVMISNAHGQLPIHLTCDNVDEQSLNCLKLMCKFCSNVNQQTTNGDTLLHLACKGYLQFELLAYLINDVKCSTRITNNQGDLALHVACRSKKLSIEMLDLLTSEVNANTKNASGNTPLHEVCLCQQSCTYCAYDKVTFLIETGAEFNIPNDEKQISNSPSMYVPIPVCRKMFQALWANNQNQRQEYSSS